MAVATSNQLAVKSADQWLGLYLRSIKVRNPQESIATNSPAWIRGKAIADVLVIHSADCQSAAAGVLLKNQNDDQLAATGEMLSIDWPAAIGASGYVIEQAGSAGSTIYAGDELVNQTTGFRYKCQTTALYNNGDPVPIVGIDTGPQTDCDPGTALIWSAPRPGTSPSTALVQAQPDGSGLSGGSDKASSDEYRQILAYALANESASGNEATVIKLAENSKAHGVAVLKAFVYPAINGPGTIGLTFLMKTNAAAASRRPNGAQLSAVYNYVVQWLPGDDSVFSIPLTAESLEFIWRIRWKSTDPGWSDAYPWPLYVTNNQHIVTAATDANTFTISLLTGPYTGVSQPVAGKAIAIFNRATGAFVRKTIKTVSGTGPWAITCDSSLPANQNDGSYVPAVNDNVSPWADSLTNVASTTIAYVDTMGPGEQVASDPGDGRRQLRMPVPLPDQYPEQITSLVVSKMLQTTGVADAQEKLALESTVSVGALTTLSYLFESPTIGVYPL
jgi:hypothetical protein